MEQKEKEELDIKDGKRVVRGQREKGKEEGRKERRGK